MKESPAILETEKSLAIQGTTPVKGVISATAALDFPSIAAQTAQELTVACVGARPGDTVALGFPAAPQASIVFFGYVSANDVVTIRAANPTAGALDPASATYRVTVFQF